MHSTKFGLIVFALTSLSIGSAHAASEINFDDVPFPGGNPLASSTLSAGYHGLDWGGGRGANSWLVSPNDATGWYGGTKQPYSHSGNNFAWSNSGTNLDLTVHGGGVFDLESFWVRGWPSYTSDVTAHGYLNGAETFVQTFTISDTYIQVPTNFSHIDRFALTMQSPRNLLIDDIHLTITPASTPAPGALLTGLLGAVPGVCLLRLRRSRRAPQSD